MTNRKHRISTLEHKIMRYEQVLDIIRQKPEDTPHTKWYKKMIKPHIAISKRTYDRILEAPIGSLKRKLHNLKQQENDSSVQENM